MRILGLFTSAIVLQGVVVHPFTAMDGTVRQRPFTELIRRQVKSSIRPFGYDVPQSPLIPTPEEVESPSRRLLVSAALVAGASVAVGSKIPVLQPEPELDMTKTSSLETTSTPLVDTNSLDASVSPTGLTVDTTPKTTSQESISGAVAGAVLTVARMLVRYPLDTATVRLQMPNTPYSMDNLPGLFHDSYRGIASPLFWYIPSGAIFFATKDATKAVLQNSILASYLPSFVITIASIALAQPTCWLIRNPSEVVKTRQQFGAIGSDVSTIDAFRMVMDESKNDAMPLASLYEGYWANVYSTFWNDVFKFLAYDAMTAGITGELSPLEGAIAGSVASGFSQVLSTPLDVVRNRAMAKPSSEGGNFVESLIRLGREEGLEGLFAGTLPSVGKAVVSGAIQFATYEHTKHLVNALFDHLQNSS